MVNSDRVPTPIERRASRAIGLTLLTLVMVAVSVLAFHGWTQVVFVIGSACAVAGAAFNCGAYVTDSHIEKKMRDRVAGQIIEGEV
jgi:hypothetical protein